MQMNMDQLMAQALEEILSSSSSSSASSNTAGNGSETHKAFQNTCICSELSLEAVPSFVQLREQILKSVKGKSTRKIVHFTKNSTNESKSKPKQTFVTPCSNLNDSQKHEENPEKSTNDHGFKINDMSKKNVQSSFSDDKVTSSDFDPFSGKSSKDVADEEGFAFTTDHPQAADEAESNNRIVENGCYHRYISTWTEHSTNKKTNSLPKSRSENHLKIQNAEDGKRCLLQKSLESEVNDTVHKCRKTSESLETSGTSLSHRKHRRNSKRRYKKCKGKVKSLPVYKCPKCDVSYRISSKRAIGFAKCFNCDYWTADEPIFLKEEKQNLSYCRVS